MPNPLEWSSEMDSLFWTNVGRLVLDDPRTDWSDNLHLGYAFDVIREQVLAKGLADFSQGYGDLTADEKVLLYCFVNLKKHFFSALATFEMHHQVIDDCYSPEGKLLLLDIGCGPGTACLALADLFPGRNFDYIGVDLAAPMSAKALKLWEDARKRGMIGSVSTVRFLSSWTELAVDQIPPPTPVLVVLSYFCASHTLTLKALTSLAHTIQALRQSRGGIPLHLTYMNSANPLANRNYEVFKQALGLDSDQPPLAPLTISYRKKRGGTAVGQEEFVHEVLCLQRS